MTSAARIMRRPSNPTCAAVGDATGVTTGGAAVPATEPATGPVAELPSSGVADASAFLWVEDGFSSDEVSI